MRIEPYLISNLEIGFDFRVCRWTCTIFFSCPQTKVCLVGIAEVLRSWPMEGKGKSMEV